MWSGKDSSSKAKKADSGPSLFGNMAEDLGNIFSGNVTSPHSAYDVRNAKAMAAAAKDGRTAKDFLRGGQYGPGGGSYSSSALHKAGIEFATARTGTSGQSGFERNNSVATQSAQRLAAKAQVGQHNKGLRLLSTKAPAPATGVGLSDDEASVTRATTAQARLTQTALSTAADARKAAWNQAKSLEKPTLHNETERLESIIKNTPATFNIQSNPDATGGYKIHEFSWLGDQSVEEHNDIIDKMAKKHGVDPDIVRSVMWAENARGHWIFGNKLADIVGMSDTPLPMNINKETGAKLLGLSKDDIYDPVTNIEAGTVMLKRIIDRVEDPTDISKIGTVWNFTGREMTNDFGEFIGRVYTEKPWSEE